MSTIPLPSTPRPARAAVPPHGEPVSIRLVAPTPAALLAAMKTLRAAHGAQIVFSRAHQGRKGGWMCYGTLHVEGERT